MKKRLTVLLVLAVLSAGVVVAEEANNKALSQRMKVLAANPDEAKTTEDVELLNDMAVKLYKAGQYVQAEPLFQRSLAIREKVLGKDHLDVAESLNNLATLYDAQGKYSQAEPLYQYSLAIYEKVLGKDHPDIALSLNNLASLYDHQGKYEQAEPLYQRSLAIKEKTLGKNHPSVALGLNNLAEFYRNQNTPNKAEPLYQRSLVIYEKALGKGHPNVAQILDNLAKLYYEQGKYELAEPLFQHSLTIREKALGKDHPDVASSLNNLALLYNAQGKYQQAEPLYQRSLAIYEKALGKGHPNVATSLNNLAWLYSNQDKYEQAEPLFQRSLTIREKVLGKNHPDVANALNNLAALYQYRGVPNKAEPLYQRSLTIREKALGKDHPNVATGLNNLAGLYEDQGKYEQAEPLYQRSLAIYEKVLGKDHPNIAITLNNLAMLYLTQDKPNEAKPLFERSLRLMNRVLDHWLWGAGEQTRQAYMQQEEGNRNAYLSFYSLANTPDEALYFSLSRKNLLLRIASEASSLAKQSHDPAIQKQKQAFDDVRTQLATLAFSGKADKTQIQALEEQANQLEMQLSQKVAGFKRGKTDVTAKAVIKKLTSQQVLIDFLVYRELDFKTSKYKTEQVIALIADAKNGVKLLKLGDLAPITEALKNYHANIVPTDANANTREAVLKQSGQTLYAQLWQPLIPYLKNKNTVYLVPDGELHLLPFKALQDTQGTYLARQQQLITLSSARDLVLPPLTGKTEKSAIFADPDYGNTETSNTSAVALKDIAFSSLPNTSIEANQIHSLLNKKSPTSLFVQKQATEQAVKDLNTPKILHLATHGFFLEQQKPDEKTLERSLNRSVLDLPQARVENPLTRSGLAFVNANLSIHDNTQTDGILTALEVLNLKLEGTDLVVLSACETGKGDIKTGESVYSLNRAFQEAGAKAVLSTLWEIDDAATVEFMQKFYTRFLGGQSAQQALQDTQHEFMQHEKYQDPFYWAGFVVTGK